MSGEAAYEHVGEQGSISPEFATRSWSCWREAQRPLTSRAMPRKLGQSIEGVGQAGNEISTSEKMISQDLRINLDRSATTSVLLKLIDIKHA